MTTWREGGDTGSLWPSPGSPSPFRLNFIYLSRRGV